MARYTAYTLDGSPVITASTAQAIADAVIDHTQEQRKPHIAYTYNSAPDYVWPYTTWREATPGLWIGTSHRKFAEVAEHLGATA